MNLQERLSELDSCTVSDAMDHHGIGGVALGIYCRTVERKISGRVITVRLRERRKGDSPDRHLGSAAIDVAQPGDIVVVQMDGRTGVSGWGGMLSRAAQRRRIAGVIIDGACRDIEECRTLHFPVYARAAVPVSARGRLVEDSFNRPIEVAGISVRPGDLVIADRSGVVFVPQEAAGSIIESAEEIKRRESHLFMVIDSGATVSEVLNERFEAILGEKKGRRSGDSSAACRRCFEEGGKKKRSGVRGDPPD